LGDRSLATDRRKLEARRELAETEQKLTELQQQQRAITDFQSAAYEKAALILPAISGELQFQVDIARKLRQDQEVHNQLHQVELKFRAQGVLMSEKDRDALQARLVGPSRSATGLPRACVAPSRPVGTDRTLASEVILGRTARCRRKSNQVPV
jgi:hypothetical protein